MSGSMYIWGMKAGLDQSFLYVELNLAGDASLNMGLRHVEISFVNACLSYCRETGP